MYGNGTSTHPTTTENISENSTYPTPLPTSEARRGARENNPTQSLLQQTSAEIKQQRRGEMVKFTEIEELIPHNTTGRELYQQIGLSARTFNEDLARGECKKVTKYAIIGLLAQKNHHLTVDELSIIFSALTTHIQTRAPQYREEVKQIQKTIMNMIVEQ